MDFAKLLKPEAVKVLTSASSKKRLMQELGDLMFAALRVAGRPRCGSPECPRGPWGQRVWATAWPCPMPGLRGCKRLSARFVLLDTPIDFSSVDRQPVDLAFALFAPEDAGVEHLKALALVSRTLRDASHLQQAAV